MTGRSNTWSCPMGPSTNTGTRATNQSPGTRNTGERSAPEGRALRLAHRHPTALIGGARDRVDRALDLKPGVEVDGQRRLAGDAIQELVRFDDLELVESHLMAWSGDELIVGRMGRPHQDLPEP